MPFRKNIPRRLIIYPRDIAIISGCKLRNAQYILQQVKEAYGKQKWQLITIPEYCEYMGLDEESVREYLLD